MLEEGSIHVRSGIWRHEEGHARDAILIDEGAGCGVRGRLSVACWEAHIVHVWHVAGKIDGEYHVGIEAGFGVLLRRRRSGGRPLIRRESQVGRVGRTTSSSGGIDGVMHQVVMHHCGRASGEAGHGQRNLERRKRGRHLVCDGGDGVRRGGGTVAVVVVQVRRCVRRGRAFQCGSEQRLKSRHARSLRNQRCLSRSGSSEAHAIRDGRA